MGSLSKTQPISFFLGRLLTHFHTTKFWTRPKLKVFADDKSNVTKMIISVFDRVENIVGKGEIAYTSNFSFFPQCFQKGLFPTPVRKCHCVGMG